MVILPCFCYLQNTLQLSLKALDLKTFLTRGLIKTMNNEDFSRRLTFESNSEFKIYFHFTFYTYFFQPALLRKQFRHYKSLTFLLKSTEIVFSDFCHF